MMMKPRELLVILGMLLGFTAQADDCDDYETLAGYGVIGESSFQSGNNSTINGNTISGSGNTPTPTGNMTTINEDFPPLNPATFPATGGSNISSNNSFTLAAGSYGSVSINKTNRSITMSGGDYNITQLSANKNGDVIYMAPGNYYIETLIMDNSTSIVLTGSGQVRLYIKTVFQAGNQVSINGGGEVGNFIVFLYSAAVFQVGNANQASTGFDFSGVIYSPYSNTTIQYGNNSDFEGAILSAGVVQVGNNTDFTYTSDTETSVIEAFGCTPSGTGPTPVLAEGFNGVHSAAGDASSGRLYTRIAGVAFNLDVVALKSSGTVETAFAATADRSVSVELVDTSGGAACASRPALSPAVSQLLTFTAGDAGRKTSANFNVAKAYSSVGVRVTDANDSPPVVGCSGDSFAIRPASISLNIPVLNNAGASGAPTAKTGDSFSLEATTVAGYDGTPVVNGAVEAHTGGTAGNLSGTFSAADINTGTAQGTGFSYSEVGNFRFPSGVITDTTFTVVDQPGDCIDNSYSNTLSSGKYGCDLANLADTDWVGRFIPHHFLVSISDPGTLDNTCGAGGFSYAGTDIPFAADPSITITAQNSANATTVNYQGAYAKLGVSDISMPAISGDGTALGVDGVTPVGLVWNTGTPSLASHNNGTFTLTLSGDSFTYQRAANDLVAPFTPDIDLTINSVVDSDSVAATGMPVSFTPDSASNGVESRYGRLNLLNAYGSELQTLPMQLRVEYYSGVSGFVLNNDDSCTSIGSLVITDADSSDSLQVGETCIWDAAGNSGAYNCTSAGSPADQYSPTPIAADFNLNLKAPGSGNTGVLDVTADAPDYLEYDWLGAGSTDPTGSASFGLHTPSGRTIYLKEVR